MIQFVNFGLKMEWNGLAVCTINLVNFDKPALWLKLTETEIRSKMKFKYDNGMLKRVVLACFCISLDILCTISFNSQS